MSAQTELVLQTSVKGTEQAVKSLNNVKGSLDGISDASKNATKSTNSLSEKLKVNKEGFEKLGIATGVATAGMVIGIKGAMKQAVDFQNALVGLRSIANGTGQDFGKAQKFIESFTKDGLVSAADAATSLKSLFQRGFSLEESIVLMDRFKDSASFGRQSALGLGEAIRGAAEGLKNENSMLVDNAGVTKNVAKMWEDYAKQIGVKTNALTLDQKREAEYQGILAETKFQIGDATKYSQGYAGAIARQDAATLQLQQTIGTALMPAMTKLTESITAILTPIAEWIAEHPKLSANIIIVTTAILGITTAIVGLGVAIPPMILAVKAIGVVLGALLSPIGLVIAGITALALILYKVYDNWDIIKPQLKALWEQIKIDIETIVTSIKNFIFGSFDAIIAKVDEAINYLAEKARQAKRYVQSVFDSYSNSSVGQGLYNLGFKANELISGARASGGPVAGGSSYLVGERGPEIFTPSSSGNIIPNHKIGGSGGGIVINISGMFGSDAAEEIGNMIVTKLTRASYV